MHKTKPLTDIEMHEILRLIYPEHIRNDDDEYFELSSEACEATIDLGDGYKVTLADLLGKIVMLTMPMQSPLTQKLSHCLGEIVFNGASAYMRAAVRRDAQITSTEKEQE